MTLTFRHAVYGAAALSGVLLGFMGQQLWGDVRAHGTAIVELKSDATAQKDLLREVRDDVKEILRRLP